VILLLAFAVVWLALLGVLSRESWLPSEAARMTRYRDRMVWKELDEALDSGDKEWLYRNGWVGFNGWVHATDDRWECRRQRRRASKLLAEDRTNSLRWMRFDGELVSPL
jgi:hypothetical protein